MAFSGLNLESLEKEYNKLMEIREIIVDADEIIYTVDILVKVLDMIKKDLFYRIKEQKEWEEKKRKMK